MPDGGFQLAIARGAVASVLAIWCAGCAPAPSASPDPAALPLDYAIVWDLPGSTADEGAGPYFDTPSSKRLRPGPVLVSWWCDGTGTLAIAPGQVANPPELPSPQSPLAFQVACPTGGSRYVGWRRLVVEAVGGENALNIRNVSSAATINYRLIFAQQGP